MVTAISAWDKAFFLFINHTLANPVCDIFFVTITNGRFWIIPGIAAALIFLGVEKKRAVLVLLLAAVTVTLTDQLATDLFKPYFHRLRPCNPNHFIAGGRFLLGLNRAFSFPSNHAMNMFGQATLFAFFYPRYSLWFFLFAGVIGYSRIYVGVHYPFDVIGGAVMGIICGVLVFYGYKIIKIEVKKRRDRNKKIKVNTA